MATRARIGILNEDGTVTASYQHWDGYPGGLGYNLVDYWTDANKVREAIALGNASKWGFIIGMIGIYHLFRNDFFIVIIYIAIN